MQHLHLHPLASQAGKCGRKPKLVVKIVYFAVLGLIVFVLWFGQMHEAMKSVFSSTPSRKSSKEMHSFESLVEGENDERASLYENEITPEADPKRTHDRDKLQAGVVNHLVDAEHSDDEQRSVLMVVAHPDDEALWGGEYLLKEGQKIHVIVTSTQNKHTSERFDEFRAVQDHLGYHGEFLDGKDSLSTTALESHIQQRIQSLICGKKWERIITHGPEGEYGHPHHQIVHDAVLDAVRMCCRSPDKLFVFEPHPSKDHVFSEAKEAALKLYTSQMKVIFRTFGKWMEQIVPFEEYDYKAASITCRDNQNPKKKVHPFRQCRLHNMFNFSSSNYLSVLSPGTFSGQGNGC